MRFNRLKFKRPHYLHTTNNRYCSSKKAVSNKSINYYEYAQKANQVHSNLLKYRVANQTKQDYLSDSRLLADGSMRKHKKYMIKLKETHNQFDHNKALSILRECEFDGVTPNIVIYSKILDIYAKCSAPNMAQLLLFEEMIIKYGIKPTVVPFSCLLNGFYQNKSYHDAIILFGLSHKSLTLDLYEIFNDYTNSREISYILSNKTLIKCLNEININVVCINILIKCLGKLNYYNKILELFESMIKSSHLPNAVTLNTMIDIFGSNRNIDGMNKLFKWWMDNKLLLKFEPDIITINSLIKGYGTVSDLKKSEELFKEYCCKEHNINKNNKQLLTPTVITFSNIIKCISNCIDNTEDNDIKLKYADIASSYYSRMSVIYGMDDHYNTCTTALMNVFLKCNDLQSTIKLFDERRSKDSKDKVMYRIAIRALFEQGLIKECLQLFDEGVKQNVLKYKSQTEPKYSLDLHLLDISSSIIAIIYNLKDLCNEIMENDDFIIPDIVVVVGKGKNSYNSATLLIDTIPNMLKDKRLFDPPIDNEIPYWNKGIIKLNKESLLKYLAHQLKVDVSDLKTCSGVKSKTTKNK